MTHDDARLLLSAVADGEAAATADLERHLDGCAECAAYAAGVARLSTLTAALPRPVAPPTLVARVRARIRRRRLALRLTPALAAATAAAVVLVTLPGPGPLRLPPAAAAEPLLRVRSLYVERTVTDSHGVTYETVWWKAPGYVRIERRYGDRAAPVDLLVERPEARYAGGETLRDVAPGIALPEPLSPTVALVGTDVGPGPVVAGLPTRRYDVRLGGETRTAYVADGLALGGIETVVLQKFGRGRATKTTEVVRVNPDLPDALFDIPTSATMSAGFAESPLDDLAIAPDRTPEGFGVVRAGRGPDGEAYVLARGSLPVHVRTGGLRDVAERRDVRGHRVGLDLYAPPSVEVRTRAGLVTVSAPLPVDSLVELATAMYRS